MAERMSKKTREVIFKAAELIKEKGFDATTVNDISRATGLTKGGLYHYIQSKEDLLFKIMLHGMEVLRETVVNPALEVSDPEEQLRMIIRGHVEVISRFPGALTTLAEEVEALTEVHRREILDRKREYFEFVRNILNKLKKQSKLTDLDTSVAAFNVLGMVLFFARWYNPVGHLTPNDVAHEMAELALTGLLRR